MVGKNDVFKLICLEKNDSDGSGYLNVSNQRPLVSKAKLNFTSSSLLIKYKTIKKRYRNPKSFYHNEDAMFAL